MSEELCFNSRQGLLEFFILHYIYITFIYNFSPYRIENTIRVYYKTDKFMLFKELCHMMSLSFLEWVIKYIILVVL